MQYTANTGNGYQLQFIRIEASNVLMRQTVTESDSDIRYESQVSLQERSAQIMEHIAVYKDFPTAKTKPGMDAAWLKTSEFWNMVNAHAQSWNVSDNTEYLSGLRRTKLSTYV